MARVGIFGGTFDPPHIGHLALAEAARVQLNLDCVLWVVAGQSPLKLDQTQSPADVRIALVSAAIAGNPGFALSRADVDRPGPHYSVDTVALIARQHPGADLYFIMGEDSLRDLPRWRRPEALIAQCRLAVFQRPGVDTDLSDLDKAIPNLSSRVVSISAPQIEVASSDLRQRISQGGSVRYLIPDPVLTLIHHHHLYTTNNA